VFSTFQGIGSREESTPVSGVLGSINPAEKAQYEKGKKSLH